MLSHVPIFTHNINIDNTCDLDLQVLSICFFFSSDLNVWTFHITVKLWWTCIILWYCSCNFRRVYYGVGERFTRRGSASVCPQQNTEFVHTMINSQHSVSLLNFQFVHQVRIFIHLFTLKVLAISPVPACTSFVVSLMLRNMKMLVAACKQLCLET